MDRRKGGDAAVGGRLVDPLLDRLRDLIGLPRPVHGEGIVLERIELRQHVEPGGPREGREEGGQSGKAGIAGKTGNPDHRRKQDNAFGLWQVVIRDGVEGVFHRQGAAVREADDMKPLARPGAPDGLTHGQPGGRHPVLPFHLGQACGNGAVAGQTDADGDKAAVAIDGGEMAKAVGGIGEAVQEHGSSDRRTLGLHDVGAVPVGRECPGIDEAAGDIPVDRDRRSVLRSAEDLPPHVGKSRSSTPEVGGPIHGVDRVGIGLVGNEGVPGLERRGAKGIPGPERQAGHDETRCQGHEKADADRDPFQPYTNRRSQDPLLAVPTARALPRAVPAMGRKTVAPDPARKPHLGSVSLCILPSFMMMRKFLAASATRLTFPKGPDLVHPILRHQPARGPA